MKRRANTFQGQESTLSGSRTEKASGLEKGCTTPTDKQKSGNSSCCEISSAYQLLSAYSDQESLSRTSLESSERPILSSPTTSMGKRYAQLQRDEQVKKEETRQAYSVVFSEEGASPPRPIKSSTREPAPLPLSTKVPGSVDSHVSMYRCTDIKLFLPSCH